MRARLLAMVATTLMAAGCDGLLGGLYDEPTHSWSAGFTPEAGGGVIRVDSRSYSQWTYIDLHRRSLETAAIGQPEPAQWDFALHHYDARTHGGAVCELPQTDLDEAQWPVGDAVFVADTLGQVAVDLSQMVTGDIVYSPAWVNTELSRWMDIDLSHMPPTYTLSHRVYLLRMTDGTAAALHFTSHTDDDGAKGFVTIRYRYPLPQ